MIRLILFTITLISLTNVSYASFPVNNVSNQFHDQSESISSNSEPAIFLGFAIIFWLGSIIWLFDKSSSTEDIDKKKKIFKTLKYLIFTPIVLFIIVLIVVFIQLSNMSFDISLDDIILE
jgi:hypothetical protein